MPWQKNVITTPSSIAPDRNRKIRSRLNEHRTSAANSKKRPYPTPAASEPPTIRENDASGTHGAKTTAIEAASMHPNDTNFIMRFSLRGMKRRNSITSKMLTTI